MEAVAGPHRRVPPLPERGRHAPADRTCHRDPRCRSGVRTASKCFAWTLFAYSGNRRRRKASPGRSHAQLTIPEVGFRHGRVADPKISGRIVWWAGRALNDGRQQVEQRVRLEGRGSKLVRETISLEEVDLPVQG